jgi:hypothetical protein
MAAYGSLSFAEQIAFFRQKVNLGTQRWDDILGAAHDRSFVVAGAAKANLLADLRAAVTKAINQGTTLAEFRKDFDALVARHGWTGWTGEGTAGGRAWRTRIIYETNLRASYAAGRWAQIQQVKAERPYLLYRHNDNVLHPRPLHVAWDGKVIPADDPWWRTHFPPNGWGCQCRVHAVDDAYLRKLGKAGPDPAPDDGTYDYFNKVSGVTLRDIPKGIDPGWDYAPGASLNLQEFITDKAAKLPGPIGQQFVSAVTSAATAQSADKAIKAAMEDCLAFGRANNRERLILLDEQSGKELTRGDGEAKSVKFTDEMRSFLDDERQSVRLIHNHPSDNPLSFADLRALTRPGVSGIDAAGHGGSIYRATVVPDGRLERQKLDEILKAADDAIYAEMRPLVTQENIKFLQWAHPHFLLLALDELGIIRYTSILNLEKLENFEKFKQLANRGISAAKKGAQGAL